MAEEVKSMEKVDPSTGQKFLIVGNVDANGDPVTDDAGNPFLIVGIVDANGDPVTDDAGNPAANMLQANVPAFPSQNWLEAVNVAGTGDNDVLYTSADVSAYNYHIFHNTSGEVIDIVFSVDGSTFTPDTSPAAVELMDDVTTGGGIKVVDIPAGKTGVLRGKFKNIRVLQKGVGTPAAGEIIIAHGVE